MNIEFVNPGVDYMIGQIMEFQTENESPFWSEPLYHFYPQLDKAYAASLPFAERKSYIERTLRAVYTELEGTINEKVDLYTRHWIACRAQITAALSEAFGVDCETLRYFNIQIGGLTDERAHHDCIMHIMALVPWLHHHMEIW